MKRNLRIGLIDFEPTRGHATLFCNLIRDRIDSHGCELAGYHGLRNEESTHWCAEHRVRHFTSPCEMAGEVDAIIIPAASDPEKHSELFGIAAELKVPVYIDKPFAESADTGFKIFRHAAASGVAVTSSSALRFSNEIAELRRRFPSPLYVESWGGWSHNLNEFLIHPVEIAVALIGADAEWITRRSIAPGHDRFDFGGASGRIASVHFHPAQQKYEIMASDLSGWERRTIASPFFIGTIESILRFFRSGKPLFPAKETALVLKIIDACRNLGDGETTPILWSPGELTWITQNE